MTDFIALLRAVNVGGTGKLPMSELKAICETAGFKAVRTFIASGNVVFGSDKSEAEVKVALEQRLAAYAGKPVGVMVRTAAELAGVLSSNPFPRLRPTAPSPSSSTAAAGRRVGELSGQGDEKLELGKREIYVHYGDGMASRS